MKVLRRKILGFTIPFREKTESGLFLGNANRGSFTRCEEFWIWQPGMGCKLEWPRGKKAFITDGFEYEPTDLDLWDQYKNDPALSKLLEFVESISGRVKTSLVHEDSILAIDDES